MKKILILGGTTEGRELAGILVPATDGRAEIISSLAGNTKNAPALPGRVRSGGFGGAAGLEQYIRDENISLVVDATHPFARQISANALAATGKTGVELLSFSRPDWTIPPGTDAVFVPDMAEAAMLVARTARRVLLTIGSRELDAFAGIGNVHFAVRMIAEPGKPLPLDDYQLLLARPPFGVEDEKKLLSELDIDTIVTKASGGAASFAKIAAASALGIRVVLVRRAAKAAGETFSSIAALADAIREKISAKT